MSGSGPKSWASQLLGLAVTLVVAGLALQWAVALFTPLLVPATVLAAIGFLGTVIVRRVQRRHQEW